MAKRDGSLANMLDISTPETNMVFVDVAQEVSASFSAYLERQKTRVAGGPNGERLRQRWVAHLDISTEDVERTLELVSAWRG